MNTPTEQLLDLEGLRSKKFQLICPSFLYNGTNAGPRIEITDFLTDQDFDDAAFTALKSEPALSSSPAYTSPIHLVDEKSRVESTRQITQSFARVAGNLRKRYPEWTLLFGSREELNLVMKASEWNGGLAMAHLPELDI